MVDRAARAGGLPLTGPALAALVALVALPCQAQTAPQLVPVLEPGKPMRFEAAPAPTTASPGIPEPCILDTPLDRRTTASAVCMRCHDGSGASNAGTGHRFDIEYDPYGKELRPEPEKFNARVILANRKVTCLSCHESLSTAPFRLAAPMGGPLEKRLCTACHIR